MEAIRRAVRKSPNLFREPNMSRHSKLSEGWSENKEAVNDGITFYMKYLGHTLLEEADEGESYGNGTSTKAIQNIVDMAKAKGKKLRKVAVTISPTGIQISDMSSKELLDDITIYRISFCSADKNHDKVFTFMARNSINETMTCHAFLCAKRKIAQAVTLTVSKAFELARDRCNSETSQRLSENTNHGNIQSQGLTNINMNNKDMSNTPSSKSCGFQYDQIQRKDADISCISEQRYNWQNFDDGDENLDDIFSRLAENRIQQKQQTISFNTDLRQEDLDDSVTQYINSNKCLEEFTRTKSMEDLLIL